MPDVGIDITANPRIVQLLARIEATRRDVAAGAPPPREGSEPELDGLYGEVGRYVHWLIRQDPSGLGRVQEEARLYAEAMDEALGVEPLDELLDEVVDFDDLGIDDLGEPSVTELPQVEFSNDSDQLVVDVRDLDEITDISGDMFEPLEEPEDLLPEPLPDVEPAADVARSPWPDDDPREITDAVPLELEDDEYTDAPDGDDDGVFALEEDPDDGAYASGGIAVRTGGFAAIPREPEEAPRQGAGGRHVQDDDWLTRLRGLLLEFGAPQVVGSDAAVQAEAVRAVERVTTNLEVHWSLYPDAVQQALLGLVGARCRRLEARGLGEAEVRLALGRLTRYAGERGLLIVPSLRDRPSGSRNWEADERRYWAVLHAGL